MKESKTTVVKPKVGQVWMFSWGLAQTLDVVCEVDGDSVRFYEVCDEVAFDELLVSKHQSYVNEGKYTLFSEKWGLFHYLLGVEHE